MYVYLSACMFECACIHIRTHVRMHASLLSGNASFPLTVDGQNPATFLLIFDFAPRAPNLILAGRGAMRRSVDWPKSCTPRAQPTNIESGGRGACGSLCRRPACAGGAGFCQSTDSEVVFCMHARSWGVPTYARFAVVRSLPRVFVITGHMGCDFVAVLSVWWWW